MARDPAKFELHHVRRGLIPADDYFVLLPTRDPAAVAALRAYAKATPDAVLAADLLTWANSIEGSTAELSIVRELARQRKLAIWVTALADAVQTGDMAVETALQRIAAYAADQGDP